MGEGPNSSAEAGRLEDRHQRTTFRWMAAMIGVLFVALLIWMVPHPQNFMELFGSAAAVEPWGWAAALVVAAAYTGYSLWALPVVRRMAGQMSWLKVMALPLAVLSGVIEELFFRQFLMDTFEGQGRGLLFQALMSALLFALAHVVWVFFARDWKIFIPVFLSTFILGLLMSGVYVLSGREILPAVLAHIAINLVIEPGLLHNAVEESTKPRSVHGSR